MTKLQRETVGLWTPKELAYYLRVGVDFVRIHAALGEIPHLKFGRRYFYDPIAIKSWLANVCDSQASRNAAGSYKIVHAAYGPRDL